MHSTTHCTLASKQAILRQEYNITHTLPTRKIWLENVSTQIAAISALLLACVYLSLGAHTPARREVPSMTVATKVINL